MSKVAKVTKVKAPDSQEDTNSELEARVAELETRVKLIAEAFEFAANELRPLYGQQAMAKVFDAIAVRLESE